MSTQIPEDIIFNILSKLPAKSVLRFRCVCKPWNNLTRDPNFIRMHLNHVVQLNNFSIILRDQSLYSLGYDFSSSFPSTTLYVEASEIDYPFKNPRYEVEVLGSSYGLICVNSDEDVISIWNPCTREFKKIPTTDSTVFPTGFTPFHKPTYGFGYNAKIDDYKLVRIVGFKDMKLEVKVYTLGSNSWRNVEVPVSYDFYSYGRALGVVVNGVFHWISRFRSRTNIIVSFDLSDELFHEVPLPEDLDNQYDTCLGVLGGCLSLLASLYKNSYELWVMEDYGVEESWAKYFTIEYYGPSIHYSRPIESFESGEVLFKARLSKGHALVLYDPEDESVQIFKVRDIPKWYGTVTYVGSLVSVNSGTYVGQGKNRGSDGKSEKRILGKGKEKQEESSSSKKKAKGEFTCVRRF